MAYLIDYSRGQGGCLLACITLEPGLSRPFEAQMKSTDVVIFACQQAVPDPEALMAKWGQGQAELRVLSEPCSSKVESFQMLRTLATPVDLVWVIGCAEISCRYQEGSRRIGGRVRYSQRYLEEIGLESGRLGHSLVTPGDEAALAAVAADVKARLESLGASPLKKKG